MWYDMDIVIVSHYGNHAWLKQNISIKCTDSDIPVMKGTYRSVVPLCLLQHNLLLFSIILYWMRSIIFW